MRYKVQNTSTMIKIYVDGPYGQGMVPIDPQGIATISDTSLTNVLNAYPNLITVLGPTVDPDAPVQKVVTTPVTWTLVDIGKLCRKLQFYPSTSGISISLSGWDSPAVAPPTASILTVPAVSTTPGDEALTIDNSDNDNLTQVIYVKGTTGSETLTIIGY